MNILDLKITKTNAEIKNAQDEANASKTMLLSELSKKLDKLDLRSSNNNLKKKVKVYLLIQLIQ